MLLLGYILVTCHKNNIVTLHVTFMLYRRNKTCLLGLYTNIQEVKFSIRIILPKVDSEICLTYGYKMWRDKQNQINNKPIRW